MLPLTPRFFGYGSLVNLTTHSYPQPKPMVIQGWARAWRHTPLRPVAYLTAVQRAGAQIEGVVAHVPNGDWAALDLREAAYLRARLPEGPEIYHIPEGHHGYPTERHPILLSYLDVVVQGYHRMFGAEGVARFFATTDGWGGPILDDRAAPRYPRHRSLTKQERGLVDRFLEDVGAPILRDTSP
ncbi:MAG: gamma-glutamylcyclotransferase family protein [Pseudomonadota bacterium]